MFFHPGILALYLSSILISLMIAYSAYSGIQILRKWDIQSGSELQIVLERKTYLISTVLTYLFGFQLISFFLFIFTVDHLHGLFVGAMCAAGTLKVNGYGYPALLLKIFNFLLAGLWLIMNYADNRGYDYPLIKKKYLFLLILTPWGLAEMFFVISYFFQLHPHIITSCCGSLFSVGEKSLASEIASLPSVPVKILFYLAVFSTIALGVFYYQKGMGGYLFAAMSAVTFLVSIVSIISFISLYYYELPTHHCPFCILQAEYRYIGYPLYIALLGSAVCGMGVGALMPFRNRASLSAIIPPLQRKLVLVSLILLLIFTILVTSRILLSSLILEA